MRVRVAYTVSVSDDYRRAINRHYGQPGLASRAEVRTWLEQYGSSADDDRMWDLAQEEGYEPSTSARASRAERKS